MCPNPYISVCKKGSSLNNVDSSDKRMTHLYDTS